MGRANPRSTFTAQERALISAWSKQMSNSFRVEIDRSFEFLEEALLVLLAGDDEPQWMVHKTPTGEVAVRLWPGLAQIVPTLSDALAVITAAVGGLSGRFSFG